MNGSHKFNIKDIPSSEKPILKRLIGKTTKRFKMD